MTATLNYALECRTQLACSVSFGRNLVNEAHDVVRLFFRQPPAQLMGRDSLPTFGLVIGRGRKFDMPTASVVQIKYCSARCLVVVPAILVLACEVTYRSRVVRNWGLNSCHIFRPNHGGTLIRTAS